MGNATTPGGISLITTYRAQMDQRFIAWYSFNFHNTRCGYIHTPVCKPDSRDFTEYHIDVAEGDRGNVIVYHNHLVTEDVDGHTYGRNTNSFSMAINGWAGDSPENFTTNLPDGQVLLMAISILADICLAQRMGFGNLMTHAEAASERDGFQQRGGKYGPGDPDFERWDWHALIHSLLVKVPNEPGLKFLKPAYIGGHAIWSATDPWVYFGDWMRGEVALLVQQRSSKIWNK